ncbi:MAG TPA: AAA family ATPase, partial [Planctomycetota bacterium]|nr:AAA family ATPase [Planctomycetota bacterium]
PELLLLDEPTAALDPSAATRIIDLVRSLATRGLGVLVVTHASEHAAGLGGTRYVVEAGRARKA